MAPNRTARARRHVTAPLEFRGVGLPEPPALSFFNPGATHVSACDSTSQVASADILKGPSSPGRNPEKAERDVGMESSNVGTPPKDNVASSSTDQPAQMNIIPPSQVSQSTIPTKRALEPSVPAKRDQPQSIPKSARAEVALKAALYFQSKSVSVSGSHPVNRPLALSLDGRPRAQSTVAAIPSSHIGNSSSSTSPLPHSDPTQSQPSSQQARFEAAHKALQSLKSKSGSVDQSQPADHPRSS